MKVTVSAGGSFHSFDLAKVLNDQKFLNQLITSYPKFYIKKNFGIDNNKISSYVFKEIFYRTYSILPWKLNSFWNSQYYISNKFDEFASHEVKDCDIFVGWSCFSEKVFKKLSKKKTIKILERGSTHIVHQNNLLKKEYHRLGIKKGDLPHEKIIQKEIREYNLADYVMVPSAQAKKTFIDNGISEKKILQIPYGVNLSYMYPVPFEHKDDKFRILFVGLLSIRKGVHYLLEAFNKLDEFNIELWLVGNVENQFKSILNKYLKNNNIKFIGPKRKEQLKYYYSKCDIFVLPSLEEGLALVLLESMACGLPVIATENTGAGDIMKDKEQGLIIKSHSSEEIFSNIILLYRNRNLLKYFAKNCLKSARELYNWETYGKKITTIYKQLYNR